MTLQIAAKDSPRVDRHQSLQLMTNDTALATVEMDLKGLLEAAAPEKLKEDLEDFKNLFQRFLDERRSGESIKDWTKIQPPPDESVIDYSAIESVVSESSAKHLLSKLVVVKLNGGLGTSMGCVGPKSLMQVRNDDTFLDITVQQIENLNEQYGSDVPLVLMNSYNTATEIDRVKHKYERRVTLHMFNQSYYPRINQETLRPIPVTPGYKDGEWYPPGHGDVYISLKRSGLLQKFIANGKEIVFVSNIDNLGATVDLNLLSYMLSNEDCDFIMEVTGKTRADVKGGTLIQYEEKVQLLEIAQVPKDKVDEFKSIAKFKVFNTNNLWVRLSAIESLLSTENEMKMDIIVNKKTLSSGLNIIQLETAAGAAIQNFQGAIGVKVLRSRFLPVKKTADLFVVMSNLFELIDGCLQLNSMRSINSLPLIKLGDQHFQKVHDFLQRFENIPDMVHLDHLTVSGNVTFGKNVVLKGTVIIIANHGERIDIPAGACLENKIVSGNLRILDH